MPAYDVDWDAYRMHKANGGTFQSFAQKTFQPLSDEQILKHLRGEHFIGIYPMLHDNTSWFIAADFDEQNWREESERFTEQCREFNLSAYLERSRSGKGAHVWIFFEKPYPAIKSRKIAHGLLERIGINSESKKTSFDRLFPNQDFLSGKGLGNLIALPLHNKTWEQGNNCFIDTKSLRPIERQWEFLKDISKMSEEQLDRAYLMISGGNPQPVTPGHSYKKLHITLNNEIHISRSHMPLLLINFLKEQLNFLSSEFMAKKKAGQNTFGTPAYFKLVEETPNNITVPRGMAGKILRFCKEQNIEFDFQDERKKVPSVSFITAIQLKDFQITAVEATRRKDIGIISAPPGSGKTIIGLSVIAEKQQPALIIVHRKQLAEQWKDRIQSFLKIPKHEIGTIGQSETRIGKKITIAMMQSLSGVAVNRELDKLKEAFGLIIVDECHHIPAETYRDCIERFHSYYLYGLTATPFRRHNDEKLLFAYLGNVIAEINSQSAHQNKEPTIIIRDTKFTAPFNSKTDKAETLLKILVHDSSRNSLILSDIEREIGAGRKAIVITERKEHTAVLHQYLKHSFEILTLSGEDKEVERKQKWKLLHEGDFDVLITTGQLFGEGSDLHSIDCLFLVYPFSFEGKLIQYMGRVQRGEFAPVIYDYRDSGIDYLDKLFLQRNKYYNKLRKKGTLKENQELLLTFHIDTVEMAGGQEILELSALELPDSVQEFRQDVRWLVRVLKFDEEKKLLFCEVVDYAYKDIKDSPSPLQFMDVKTIRFRSLDTDKFLKCVIIKNRVPGIINAPGQAVGKEQDVEPKEIVEETIKIPVSMLEFGYGFIRFSYFPQQLYQQIIFEIANEDIRPEFAVLKPYFAKALKSKKVKVGIRLEIQNGNLISKNATSFDLERLNHEVIEGMKFSFIAKDVLGRKSINGAKGILDLNGCINPSQNAMPLYKSEQGFLDDLLKWKSVKHFHQLKYLAQKHDENVLRIRFTLTPFSFVFVITGEKQYHIVLETLDTEEATYIWHLDKHADVFHENLQIIDQAIVQLRSEGRQAYLDSNPENFSRIVHDYSDPKKGFVLWKGVMEERII
jgi:superfamily II DNA or RNA helicase